MILDNDFNLDEFSDWIENFLPEFSIDVRSVGVPSGFSEVKSIKTLGESSLGVRVFIIETLKDPSGRKVGLAKDSFNLIKNYGTPNALIAYHSNNIDAWRFSLVTSTPTWNDGRIITKLSNPKRHSYVLGPKAKVNTPTKFLVKKGRVLDFADLKSRFSLEVVNKEFYKEISESFTKLVGGTRGEGKNKKTYESLLKLPSTNDHSQASIEFAVRLIGRLIFCWFLKEKISESGNSLMPRALLSLDAISDNSDYYHKILEPIFFEILNKQIKSRKDPYSSEPYALIPYLNGGLFSPHDDDFFSYNEGKQAQFHNTVLAPDEWFKELFGILETYNFTIDENTSIDEDLSIDPEMLGRIFENLLAEINPETGESARKSTGSYYTPRVIVDYMVDESLLLYLKQKTNIDEEKLRAIISYDLSDDFSYPLSEDEKKELVDAIEQVKILDPACGSGAYPIGALQKIVFILQQIDPDGQTWFKKQIKYVSAEFRQILEREFTHKNFDWLRKLGIIRENIYGIDIQPIATEISRLRCFLTLVVDERIDDSLVNRGIEPLPNLDFKFVTANSLIGLPKIPAQGELFDDSKKIEELRELRDRYFTARDEDRKDIMLAFSDLQSEMINDLINKHSWAGVAKAELTRKLTDWKPFKHRLTDWFDPEWMFGIKEGFDIVIANPPYINISKVDKNYVEVYRKIFESTRYGRFDLYVAFVELGLNLLKEGGVQSFIVPDKICYQKYATKIRKIILKTARIDRILDLKGIRVFESAVVDNIVYVLQKNVTTNNYVKITNVQIKDSLENVISKKPHMIDQYIFNTFNESMFRLNIDNIDLDLQKKVDQKSIKLNKICYVSFGLQPGNLSKFVFNRNETTVEKIEMHKDVQKKFLRGRNINRYYIEYSDDIVYYLPKELHRPAFPELFDTEKIIVSEISRDIKAALDKSGYYSNEKTVVVKPWHMLTSVSSRILKDRGINLTDENLKISNKFSLAFILAILNSKLVNYYFQKFISDGLNVYPDNIRVLPIPEVNDEIQDVVISIMDKIDALYTKYPITIQLKEKLDGYQRQLDEVSYKYYGLTDDEVKIVEGN